MKCFTKDQEHRTESYRLIAEELKQVDSEYLTSLQYLENELFVDSGQTSQTEFPVVLMDWVEGKTLDKYLREHLDDEYELEMLAYSFSQLAQWIISQPFAHGDLKPDNILVREDGTLVLVDYDGMYVPAMQGQKARELGSPDFRHPLRTENDFDEHIDDFPLVSILLSLKAIAVKPSLLGQYGASDRLLFSENDYRNIGQCSAFQTLLQLKDAELEALADLLSVVLIKKYLSSSSRQLLVIKKPKEKVYSTSVTCLHDWVDSWVDEYGVKYSADGKRLLWAPRDIRSYNILKGTKAICDEAFENCIGLTSLHIPEGVTYIGESAFYGCIGLTSLHIPESVTNIGYSAFDACIGLTSLRIPEGVTSIDYCAFSCCNCLEIVSVEQGNTIYDSRNNCNAVIRKDDNTLIVGCKNTIIPEGVTSIGNQAFYGCIGLTSLHIPEGVTSIGRGAFSGCSGLTSLHIPEGVTSIGYGAFYGCSGLTSLHIPESVTSIGDNAFKGCSGLTSIQIPEGVTSIGWDAFAQCI